MVRKVVIPATISVLTLVLFSLSLNIRSSICVLPPVVASSVRALPCAKPAATAFLPSEAGEVSPSHGDGGAGISSVTHDPSVGVSRRHLPLLRKGRRTSGRFAFAGRLSYSPRRPRTPRARTQPECG